MPLSDKIRGNALEKTWVVMCPRWESAEHINKPHGWALFKKALEQVGSDYFNSKMDCIVCGNKFSLQQGVSEAFASDVAINDFLYNASERGQLEITVGKLTKIHFAKPFESTPTVILNPYLKHVDAVPGYITASDFVVFSCSNSDEEEKRNIIWHAIGNRASETIPIWRGLLSNAKGHQLGKNYRSEIVELESAFEVFIAEYLGKNLKTKLRQGTIDWLLKLSIEEQIKIGFMELAGHTLAKLYPTEYREWQKSVKEMRDKIVHRGFQATPKQAKDARKATFDLITRADTSSMEHFQIQMKNIGVDGPHLTFGTATGTETQQAIQHGLCF